MADIHHDQRFPGGIGKTAFDVEETFCSVDHFVGRNSKFTSQIVIDKHGLLIDEKRQEVFCMIGFTLRELDL